MYWDTFPGKPKEAELRATCYVSRQCQVNGPFSFQFFPILLCQHLVLAGNYLIVQFYFQLRPDQVSQVGISSTAWKRTRCRIDHVHLGSAGQFLRQQRGLFVNRISASLCMLVKIPLPSFKFVSNLDVTNGKNKFFVLQKLYYFGFETDEICPWR